MKFQNKLISPRLLKLQEDINKTHNKKSTLDQFWNEMKEKQTPLIESIEEEPDYYLVTFLHRFEGITNELRVNCQIFGWIKHRQVMKKINDTDVYYNSIFILPKTRIHYSFIRATAKVPDYYRLPNGNIEEKEDPLNNDSFIFDPVNSDEKTVSSILETPGVKEQIWIKNYNNPRGSVETFYVKSKQMKKEIQQTTEFWQQEKNKLRSINKKNTEIKKQRLEDHKQNNKINNIEEDQGYQIDVYLPPNYDSKKSYPCVVVFDGAWYNNESIINGPLIYDNLISENKIPEVVGIFIHQKNRTVELVTNDVFATFIAETVLEEVKERYSISSDPSETVIAGASFGGLMSMYMGLIHPNIFGKVLCQSGAFWTGERFIPGIQPNADKDNFHYLIDLYKNHEPVNIEIYMEIGVYEGKEALYGMPSPYYSNIHMRDVLELKGYELTFYTYKGGHDFVNWRESYAEGLIKLFS